MLASARTLVNAAGRGRFAVAFHLTPPARRGSVAPMQPDAVFDDLCRELNALRFGAPVAAVYNPLDYARAAFDQYLHLHGQGPREALLIGMNPGPWGMAQTGVPFGDVSMVRDWLGVEAEIGRPPHPHPKRPVLGFACKRGEVSGRRLWGWARDRFETPQRFFARFFVINYCPLCFFDCEGRNLTPDKLPAAEREPLAAACNRALRRLAAYYAPRIVIGVGAFAEARAKETLRGMDVAVGRIPHPSPASPLANRGWADAVAAALREYGITP